MLQRPPCVNTAGLHPFLHGLGMCQTVWNDEKQRMLNGLFNRLLPFDHETDCVIKFILLPACDMNGDWLHVVDWLQQ